MRVCFIETEKLGIMRAVVDGIMTEPLKRQRVTRIRRLGHVLITLKLINDDPIHYMTFGSNSAGEMGLLVVQDANAPVAIVHDATLPKGN